MGGRKTLSTISQMKTWNGWRLSSRRRSNYDDLPAHFLSRMAKLIRPRDFPKYSTMTRLTQLYLENSASMLIRERYFFVTRCSFGFGSLQTRYNQGDTRNTGLLVARAI